ncbi:hypothetical protein EP47_04835 [Legionella norrlandica]|uniref:Flagellar basal-body rod protein FlgC n=1 Tax=Legionella norrlandica TaxID=1498499 RepID=A0A0A2SVC9_9GAMM|nr:flagellar basal body rod protein FlgC [Legionella norrlandica]KGP63691.1 hypothetical protein EP47_04835 [Legionella norrlandica]
MDSILNIAASSMSAENERLTMIARNIANSSTIGSSPQETYRAKHPIFSEVQENLIGIIPSEQPIGGVRITGVYKSNNPLDWRLEPGNPLADKDGKVYITDVNPINEMADMISASKQYQASVEVLTTAKDLKMQVIKAINNI